MVGLRRPEELVREVDRLQKGTLAEHERLIGELGEYFESVLPSVVNDTLILKTEVMTRNLLRDFDEVSYPPSLKEDLIRPTLGIASALSREIRLEVRRSGEFHEDVTRLGEKLSAVCKAISITKI